jgi:Heavy metal binding domain
MKKIFLIPALVISLAGAGCQGTPAQEEKNTQTATEQAATPADSAQMAYVCPMGCEGSASDKPGKCPVCGMDLVKNTNHAAADSAAHPAH